MNKLDRALAPRPTRSPGAWTVTTGAKSPPRSTTRDRPSSTACSRPPNARGSPASMRMRSISAATSAWPATASAAANTATSAIRFRPSWRVSGRPSTRNCRPSPTHGTSGSASRDGIPLRHDEFIDQCHAAGQARPTPLLLQYGPGDFNCLHQDLYGDLAFPLQVAILLSEPGADFTGGEFVLTEQRPRMQSRAEVVPLRQGSGVAFAVHQRPVQGTRGVYRVNMRHGVSRLRSGQRHTLGIIFHDAK
jgi:hypothetical protein